jgi:tRNA threonylcarbamoyladenosine biosynthesis protein TsaE
LTPSAFEVVSRTPAETREAGRRLAPLLAPGTLVFVSGPLGAGKTELVRGVAEGLGADPGEVASPTFALVHEYGPPGLAPVLLHADLYRLLGTPGLGAAVEDLGLAEARARGAVVVVEWPEALAGERCDLEVGISMERDEARRIVVRRAS